jgi:LysR family transcriptional regulator, glycine cleavage system transcriptional activator
VAKIRREQSVAPLTISTGIPFASLWLLPRLPRFRERHPEVDVFISADNRMLDLDRERIDLAVRYCPESLAPRDAHRLFGERLQPVCSPALASDPARPLKQPEDLARHVLLNLDADRGRYPWLNWAQWFAAIGVPEPRPAGMVRFNQYDLLVQAAIDGQGVALGRSPLVDHLVAQGKLVAPFRRKHATSRAYFIVRAAQAARRPEAQAFVDWLHAEAHEETVEPAPAALPGTRRAGHRKSTARKKK